MCWKMHYSEAIFPLKNHMKHTLPAIDNYSMNIWNVLLHATWILKYHWSSLFIWFSPTIFVIVSCDAEWWMVQNQRINMQHCLLRLLIKITLIYFKWYYYRKAIDFGKHKNQSLTWLLVSLQIRFWTWCKSLVALK